MRGLDRLAWAVQCTGEDRHNTELNLEVDSTGDRRDFKAWFDDLWNDDTLMAGHERRMCCGSARGRAITGCSGGIWGI